APTAASPAITVPEMVWVATAEVSAAVAIVTVGATVSSVNPTGVKLPVLPAASVSWATMLWAPSPVSVTLVLHTPPLPTVAVPICVVTPLTVSSSVTVAPTAASPAITVPEMVWVATAEVSAAVAIVTVGATVSSVNTTGVELPVLPAASVSWATMLWAPSPVSVTLVLHTPPLPTVAVPICVVTPLTVSSSVTVAPTAASPAITVPEMVWVATAEVSAAVAIVTVGATVSSVNTTGAELPVLPAASVSWATMLWAPSPVSVTLVLHTPPLPTVAVPICVVTPLTVSSSVTVAPTAASPAITVPEMVWVATAEVSAAVAIVTVGATVSSVNPTGVKLPVLPAASVSWATMLWAPSPVSVTLVLHTPPLPTVAVPICVVTPLTVSSSVTVAPTAASPAITVPEMVWVATAEVSAAVAIVTVGATVSSVNTTGVELPVLPAASVSWATMLWAPSPVSVTLVLHTPPLPTVAVPICVVTPLTVSSSVTVAPTAASPAITVPEMVWVATAEVSAAVAIVTVGATVSSVNTTGAELPVLPAASVSWATMLWAPSPVSVTLVLHTPPLPTVAVPICVVTPLTVSSSVTVAPTAASPAITVPEMVWVATAEVSAAVAIVTVGATVSSVNPTGVKLPVLPAASVSWATMLWAPSPVSVTLVLHTPPLPTVAVPICVVTPLTVSSSVTVAPTAASPAITVPEMVWVATAEVSAAVAIVTVGATVSSVNTTGVELPVLPAASVSWATMLWAPSPVSVTLVLHTPPLPTVAVPICVVTPLTVSSSVTVAPTAASPAITVPEMVWVATAEVSAAVAIVTVGATVSSVNTTGAELPVLPAASVSWATMLWAPSPVSVTLVLHTPPLPTVAVPICVVTPLTVSSSVTVAPTAASPAITVPEMVWVATAEVSAAVAIVTVGATVSSVNPTGVKLPVLPAASVSWATMLWAPSPVSVTLVLHTPPLPTVAVPICVVTPLTVSSSVTVAPTAASPAITVPEMVWVATAEVSAAVAIVTVGATVSSVNTTGVELPVLPAASVSWATMLWAPSPVSVTLVLHTPPLPTVAVPICVVTPLTVSSSVTVAPTAASPAITVPEMVWVATAEVSAAVAIVTVGATVSSVNTTGVELPVLPAASVSWATMLWAPSPVSVTLVLHTPPLPTVAVPICVVTPVTLSSRVCVAAIAGSPAITVPEMVWVATAEVSAAVAIVTVGATVSSVNTTGVELPVLPAASGSWATMLWAPSPVSVTLVLHTPPLPTVAVPICVVTPLTVSSSVTVAPTAASPAITVPEMVWVATAEVSAAVAIVTVGATVSSVNTTGVELPVLPAASVSWATMLWAPSPVSVTLVLHTPPLPTVAVPICVVTPLTVSSSVTVAPTAASPAITVPEMVWVATAEVSAAGGVVTVGATVSSVNTTGVELPVLPAASVSWATMLWAPSPVSVTLVLHTPPLPTVAVPICVVTPLTVSSSVTVAPTAASPAITVPEMVWVATAEVSAAVAIVTVGATVSSVNTTGVELPVLPAASGSWATMLWAPSPVSVTLVLHTPPLPTVAVPICVVTPLTVSSSVTVAPTAASPAITVPEMVWVATAEVSAAVAIVTVGATVSSVNTTGVELPVLPAASVSWATMLWAPSPVSVTLVLHTPPLPTVAVPICVVTPLTVSSSVTVAPTAASPAITVPEMVWVATAEVSAAGGVVTVGATVSSVNTTGVELPVLPAASVSWATMLWAPSPVSVTLVLHTPPLPTVAVPICVVTPLTVSSSVTVAPTAASPAITVPEMVWVATAEVSAAVAIVTVGATVSSVNTTGVELPVLPAASVSWATMLWAPSPVSVTLVLHTPPLPTVAVPICVVTPLTVSSSVTVAPTAASPAITVPEMVWVATAEVSAAVAIVTVGATVSSVNTTGVELPVLPAASVSWATMLWAPSPVSVTLVLHTPPLPTVAVPICVVTPLTVSSSVTVAPTAASPAITVPEMVWVATAEVSAAVAIVTVGATVSSVNTTGVELPVLPAASVSWATMLWAPSPVSVTLVLHTPPLPTVAVPICVVTPLTVSSSVTVAPTAASPAITVPEM